MKEYIFVLGREPELSFLEVISFFKSHNIDYKIVEHNEDIVIFLLKRDLNFDDIIKRLGGVIKIAEVFKEYEYNGNDNRLNYGISVYKGNQSKLKSYLEKVYKKEKVKAMIRKPREGVYSPTEILSKKLNEFVVYGDYWGKTIAFFNPKLYMERDETRPRQIPLHQVSLRLAKILINLSQARNSIMDPFCGVGTILQEGMLNDLEVYGMDLDLESVKASNQNLNWLKDKYHLEKKFKIINGDSTKLTRYIKRNFVDAIVTEPYMGPYFKRMPQRPEVEKTARDLEKFYYEFLLQARQILKKNGKVSMVIPRLKYHRGQMDLRIDNILRDTGFEIEKLDSKIKFPMVSKGKFLDRLIYVFNVK